MNQMFYLYQATRLPIEGQSSTHWIPWENCNIKYHKIITTPPCHKLADETAELDHTCYQRSNSDKRLIWKYKQLPNPEGCHQSECGWWHRKAKAQESAHLSPECSTWAPFELTAALLTEQSEYSITKPEYHLQLNSSLYGHYRLLGIILVGVRVNPPAFETISKTQAAGSLKSL